MRPTERRPDGPALRDLADDEAPDFLEGHRVALLAFLDPDDPACAKMRDRLGLVVAKWQAAGPAAASPAAGSLAPFGAGVVDVTRHRLVAEALGIKSVPTVVLFVGGAVVDRLMGTPPESVLDDVLKARLARNGP